MINKQLLDEINHFCEINDISDVTSLINKMLSRGFTIEKFGETPKNDNPKIIEKEIIKEVPVEVEKIVKVTDDSKTKEIIEGYELEIKKLKLKIKELEEKINNNSDIYGE